MPDGLSETKKLVWLGLKNPKEDINQAAAAIQKLKNNVGKYETFQDHLDTYDLDGDGSDEDISTFTQFKTYLEDNGFGSIEADSFIQEIKTNFEDSDGDGSTYGDFETYVQDTGTGWGELQSQFGTVSGVTGGNKTPDGRAVAGIIFHEEGGVSRDGVQVPAGTTEIIGRRVEFSQSAAPETGEPTMSYSNLQVDNIAPNTRETITISATLANTGSVRGRAYPQLKIGGRVEYQSGPIQLDAGESTTVQFPYTFFEMKQVDVTIADLSPITVTVYPGGLL